MSLSLRLLEGGPLLVERAATQTLTFEIGSATTRERVAITSGTLTLYDSARTALVSAASITPSTAIPGQATYSLSSASVPATLGLGDGYRASLSVVVAGVTYTMERDVRLCRQAPPCPIGSEDLYALHPDLRGAEPPEQHGAGVGWAPQIDAAWKEFTQRLADKGRRHELIWSVGSPFRCVRALALRNVFGGMLTRMDAGSRYEALEKRYADEFMAAWNEFVFETMADETGARTGRTEAGTPMLTAHAGPRGGGLFRGLDWGRGWGRA